MGANERDALLNKKNIRSVSNPFEEFGEPVHVGNISVPKGINITQRLEQFFENSGVDASHLMDARDVRYFCRHDFSKRGQRFSVKLLPILNSTTTEHCGRVLQGFHSRPLGALGLSLMCDFPNLPQDIRLLSLLTYKIGERLSGLVKHSGESSKCSVIRPYYDGVRHKGELLVAFIPAH